MSAAVFTTSSGTSDGAKHRAFSVYSVLIWIVHFLPICVTSSALFMESYAFLRPLSELTTCSTGSFVLSAISSGVTGFPAENSAASTIPLSSDTLGHRLGLARHLSRSARQAGKLLARQLCLLGYPLHEYL